MIRHSITATGGAQDEVCVTEMDKKKKRVQAIMSEVALLGIQIEDIALDIDLHQPDGEDMDNASDSNGIMQKIFLFNHSYKTSM